MEASGVVLGLIPEGFALFTAVAARQPDLFLA